MREVTKKSADAAVNDMIVKAFRAQIDLAWDRAEAIQPQCGFGRLALCCSDCRDGPCRTSPFAEVPQATVCGRSQQALADERFVARVADGAAALAGLAGDFGAELDAGVWKSVCAPGDAMWHEAGTAARLARLGQASVAALRAIAAVKARTYGAPALATTGANLGVLRRDAINVVFLGNVPPRALNAFADAARPHVPGVNLCALCGAEANGGLALPVLSNYQSQEAPLLTGAVDLLVVGTQCVMPATVALAGRLQIPVVAAAGFDDEGIVAALRRAADAFAQRAGKTVQVPAVVETLRTGYRVADSTRWSGAIRAAVARGEVRAVAYLGGCGSRSVTQDAGIVDLARRLIADGHLVISSGCAGAALAKAGLCRASSAAAARDDAPDALPPVLHVGACHDASAFLDLAAALDGSGVPVVALMTELTHGKVLATAIGFAASGIPVYLDPGEAALPALELPGRVQPLAAFATSSPAPAAALAVN